MPKAKVPVLFPFHPVTGSLYVEEPFNSQSHGYWNDGRNHRGNGYWENDYDANIDWARQRGSFDVANRLEAEKNNGLASGELTFSSVKANMLPHFILEAPMMRFVEALGPGKSSAVLVLEDPKTKSRYPMLVSETNELLRYGVIDNGKIINIKFWGFVKVNNRYGIKVIS